MHQAVPSTVKWELCHLSVVTQAKNEVATTFQRAKIPVIFSRAGKKAPTNLPVAVSPFASQVCGKQWQISPWNTAVTLSRVLMLF